MIALPSAPAPEPRRQVFVGTAVAVAAVASLVGGMLALYLRMRANRHHETLVSTESRLSRWSLLEIVTVLLVAALEVLLVQRWFSDDAPLGAPRKGASSGGGFGLAAPPSATRMRTSV